MLYKNTFHLYIKREKWKKVKIKKKIKEKCYYKN